MRRYFKDLPNRPVEARRRFVVVATVVSLGIVLVLWAGILSLGRGRSEAFPASTPVASLEESALPIPEGAEPTPARSLEPSPLVNVEELSTNLLRALGQPRP